jgi:DNA-directed RNA polymerase specialized sigma24 family protein
MEARTPDRANLPPPVTLGPDAKLRIKALSTRLFALLASRAVHPALRPDLVQETLLALHRRETSADEPLASPEAWAVTVIMNRVRDQHRRARRSPFRSALACDEDSGEPDRAEAGRPRHHREDPEAQLAFRRVEGWLADYVERAARKRPAARAQVRTWIEVQVLGRSVSEVRARREAEGEAPSEAALWKWCQRGRALALELAEQDELPMRADAIRRLTECGTRWTI